MALDMTPPASTNGLPYQPVTGAEIDDYQKAIALGFVPNGTTTKDQVRTYLIGLGVT